LFYQNHCLDGRSEDERGRELQSGTAHTRERSGGIRRPMRGSKAAGHSATGRTLSAATHSKRTEAPRSPAPASATLRLAPPPPPPRRYFRIGQSLHHFTVPVYTLPHLSILYFSRVPNSRRNISNPYSRRKVSNHL